MLGKSERVVLLNDMDCGTPSLGNQEQLPDLPTVVKQRDIPGAWLRDGSCDVPRNDWPALTIDELDLLICYRSISRRRQKSLLEHVRASVTGLG